MYAVATINRNTNAATIVSTFGSAASASAFLTKFLAAVQASPIGAGQSAATDVPESFSLINTVAPVQQGDTIDATGPLYTQVAAPAA